MAWLALVVLAACAGSIGYFVGKASRPEAPVTDMRTDFVGRSALFILTAITCLVMVSYFYSPQQWEFVKTALDIFDRSLFLCFGYLIRDKQDTPATVAVVTPPPAAPPETIPAAG